MIQMVFIDQDGHVHIYRVSNEVSNLRFKWQLDCQVARGLIYPSQRDITYSIYLQVKYAA